ncbi:MAG: ABC transporter permease [Thermosynechococcaceae cyanobacterium MS004]|nr:ABC transporter permease [Thermosynechococcaceae cyanobacterium MS004]
MTQPAPVSHPSSDVSLLSHLKSVLSSEIVSYSAQRLVQALITLVLASALCFAVIQLSPSNYLDTLKLNPKISPERVAELQKLFGLDRPPLEQYLRWAWRVFTHFDFGDSFIYQRPVSSLLLERVPNTLLMSIASILVTWAIAIPLGIVGAVNQNKIIDRVLQVLSYIGQGFPSFITALALLFFAQSTPFFPVGNMTSVDYADLTPLGKVIDIGWHMILPTLALSITSFAGLQRITRGNLLDVLRQNYIQTARAKGLPENRVIYVHALRNALNALVTLLGFEFASLLGGAFITENFFNWPGLGRLTLQAVQSVDLYLIMGSLMMGATMLILGNFLADLLLKAVDPRIELNDRGSR